MLEGDDRRIRQLMESAAQASASGREQEAERLVRQAEAEAPSHPLVLNDVARRMLLAGNLTGAYDVLAKAIKGDPGHASLWLNLAATLRGLKRGEEEMFALEKVLALDPRNVRALLQTASLQEIQGKPREAAASYRTALQTLPQGVEPPAAMRPILQYAQRVVEANDRALESFLEERLKALREQYADETLDRFDRCLATLLRKRRIYRQQPSFMYFPNLPTIEFYERSDFPWLDSIEAATDEIRAELLNLLSDPSATMEPYVTLSETARVDQWRELNHSRRWGVYYLWHEGVANEEHIARCPRTVAALKAWPRCIIPGAAPSALFSVLDARTRIPPHSGTSNTRLIVHLPLIIPPDCSLRVGAERREWHPGKAFVFDDTVEHEAWNDSDVPRAVLIFDIWSPFLSEAERDLVRTVTAGVSEFYGTRTYRDV